MSLNRTSHWRDWAGRVGTLCCILLSLAVLDALVSRFREPLNQFSGLPGSRIPVNGPLAEKIENPRAMAFQTNSREIHLVFEDIQTGFWFGGYLWNGTLIIGPRIEPGRYSFVVKPANQPGNQGATRFEVEIFKDQAQLDRNSKSFFLSTLGVRPWRVLLFCIPLIGLSLGIVFFLSQKADRLLAEQGQAEVYQVRKGESGHEIYFGLGRQQGIHPGTRLSLYHKNGQDLGAIVAQEVFEGHSMARVDPGIPVEPGFMISQS